MCQAKKLRLMSAQHNGHGRSSVEVRLGPNLGPLLKALTLPYSLLNTGSPSMKVRNQAASLEVTVAKVVTWQSVLHPCRANQYYQAGSFKPSRQK